MPTANIYMSFPGSETNNPFCSAEAKSNTRAIHATNKYMEINKVNNWVHLHPKTPISISCTRPPWHSYSRTHAYHRAVLQPEPKMRCCCRPLTKGHAERVLPTSRYFRAHFHLQPKAHTGEGSNLQAIRKGRGKRERCGMCPISRFKLWKKNGRTISSQITHLFRNFPFKLLEHFILKMTRAAHISKKFKETWLMVSSSFFLFSKWQLANDTGGTLPASLVGVSSSHLEVHCWRPVDSHWQEVVLSA